jgi:hypothetical protein
MSLIEYAEEEIKAAGLNDPDSDYNGNIGKAVLELIQVFSNQGHSGMSASIVRELFSKLSKYEPLLPITGGENEWVEVSDSLFQNNRLSNVFKQNGRIYYLDAITFVDERGSYFSGTCFTKKKKKSIMSRQLIKSFPFIPKTFIVKVFEKNDQYLIKDKKELKEVFKYYDYYET